MIFRKIVSILTVLLLTHIISYGPLITAQSDPSDHPPVADFKVTILDGYKIRADASRSFDPDGDPMTYEWDWGDGSANSTDIVAKHTYDGNGVHKITLKVTDVDGMVSIKSKKHFLPLNVGLPPISEECYIPILMIVMMVVLVLIIYSNMRMRRKR